MESHKHEHSPAEHGSAHTGGGTAGGGAGQLFENRWAVAAAVFAILFIGALALLLSRGGGQPPAVADNASAAQQSTIAKLKVEKFLDVNFLAGKGYRAEVGKVEPYDDYLNIMEVSIKQGDTTLQVVPVYATKNGDTVLLYAQAFKTNETVAGAGGDAAGQQPSEPPAKADKPKANLFIMSLCPYGLQMLKAYVPVMELLGDKAELDVNFVYYTMHGDKEREANGYIACVQREQKEKLAQYLRCFVEAGDYKGCMAKAGVDAAKEEACVAALDKQYNITALAKNSKTWLSGRFPLYPVDDALNKKYGVGGSPTFVLNGKEADVERSAESIKGAVCSSFSSPPAECSKTLSSAVEASGLGGIGGGSAEAGEAASCGG